MRSYIAFSLLLVLMASSQTIAIATRPNTGSQKYWIDLHCPKWLEAMKEKIQKQATKNISSFKNKKVSCSFNLDNHGNIQNLKLLKPSDFPEQNKIALEIIEKSGPLPKSAALYEKRSVIVVFGDQIEISIDPKSSYF